MTTTNDKPVEFTRRDMAQVAMGACIMGFPMAATEEIWTLGTELPLGRVLLFALASFSFLALLIAMLHHRIGIKLDRRVFFRRVFYTYGFTLLIAALLLFGIDRIDLINEPLVSLKRAILVAFPASFAATVVDTLR